MATKDFNTATLTAKYTFLEPTTTADTTLYTVPASSTYKVQSLSLCNRHSTTLRVQVYVIPSGATLNVRHCIVRNLDMAFWETVSLQTIVAGMMLGEGDKISVNASVANVLSVHLSGVEGV